jgi:fermentation-respiration switch protein FrsA (DUF1100 family)
MVMLGVLGTLVVGGYAAVCGLVYKHQDSLLYFPEDYMGSDPASAQLDFEEFSIEVAPDVTVTGWIVEKDPSAPWILQFHGNAGNISNRVPHLKLFSELGFNGVLFDYRGYGKSTGTPSEDGLVEDGLAVVKYLKEEKGVDRKFLIYWGESLGGAVAAAVAVKEEPRALILKSTFTSVPDLASETYPFLPVRYLSKTQFDTKNLVPNFLFPKLVVHGHADRLVPFHHGQRLFQLSLEPKTFLKVDRGHNASPLELGDEFKQTVQKFVTESVPQDY